MFRGRTIVGEEIMLGCSCDPGTGTPTFPDNAPTMKVYDGTGTLIVSKQIPPLDKFSATGFFQYMLPINSAFTTGRYVVLYTYEIGTFPYVAGLDTFEVVDGGDDAGQILSMFYLDRSDGQDFILAQTEQGSLTISRGPKI